MTDRDMLTIAILVGIPLVGWALWSLFTQLRSRKRRALMKLPLPDAWIDILEKNIPPYAKLGRDQRRRLHSYIQVFLAEKKFEGCGGLEITDETRVTIAAQACLLFLNRKPTFYPRLSLILVYPHAYVAGGKGLLNSDREPPSVRLGESWDSGTVVLSWDNVRQGAANFHDGHNVTMHEFAHQLDQEDGDADGAPILDNLSCYATWAATFTDAYRHLQKRTRKGRKTVLDKYGATNPAEFFAVATTTFFEKPRQMKQKYPDLYWALQSYYKVDPLDWI